MVRLAGFAALVLAADPPDIVLWPAGLPEPKVQTELPEKYEVRPADGIGIRTYRAKGRVYNFNPIVGNKDLERDVKQALKDSELDVTARFLGDFRSADRDRCKA